MIGYTVTLTNGTIETVNAEFWQYDGVGNLGFWNSRKTLVSKQHPEGMTVDIVKVYNSRHYVSFEPTPTKH